MEKWLVKTTKTTRIFALVSFQRTPPPFFSHLWRMYFATRILYLIISLTYFSPLSPSSSLATTCLFSVSITLFLLCSCVLFLDSTYNWNHTVFDFLKMIQTSFTEVTIAQGNFRNLPLELFTFEKFFSSRGKPNSLRVDLTCDSHKIFWIKSDE